MMTKLGNHIYYAACLIVGVAANLPLDWWNPLAALGLPPQQVADAKVIVTALIAGASWIKSHKNLLAPPPEGGK